MRMAPTTFPTAFLQFVELCKLIHASAGEWVWGAFYGRDARLRISWGASQHTYPGSTPS
jgi:hypothetical protein